MADHFVQPVDACSDGEDQSHPFCPLVDRLTSTNSIPILLQDYLSVGHQFLAKVRKAVVVGFLTAEYRLKLIQCLQHVFGGVLFFFPNLRVGSAVA